MKRVLISAPYMQREREFVEPLLDAHGLESIWPPVEERLEEAELLRWIADVDGVICGDDRFTPRVIDAAKRLKVIVKWGTGIDSIDKAYAEGKGIPVRNTPGAFTEPVSDSALAYLLLFSRNLLETQRILRGGGWSKPPGWTLSERTVGIVGFGKIGRRLAEKLQPFGARVLACDRAEIAAEEYRSRGVEAVGLEMLLAESHYISLHCDLNPSSRYLFDAARIGAMRRDAVLINTARGPIIEEEALLAALRGGLIAGAALDVFEHEPLAADHPLRFLPNLFVSAHATNASPRAWRMTHENSIRMLVEGVGGANE